MILDKATPILALAFDRVPDLYNMLAPALSRVGDVVPESEILSLDFALDKLLLSDVLNPGLRLFIPITDELYDAHYTGSQSSHNKGVHTNKMTRQDGSTGIETEIAPGRNATTLVFNIRSNLSQLSVIADIITALTKVNTLNSANVPRASFFSSTRCIFNARLVGVNRTTSADTDKETVSITLEEGDGEPLDKTNKDTPPVTEPELANIVGGSKLERLNAENTQVDATLDDFDFDRFDFYPVLSRSTLLAMPVPDMISDMTIQRQDVRLFRVTSMGFNKLARDMQGVEFAGQHVSLESSEPFRYEGNLGLVRYFGDLYLGVARAG